MFVNSGNPRALWLAGVACLPLLAVACSSKSSPAGGVRDAAGHSVRDGSRDGSGDGDGSIDAGPPSVTCTDGTIVANETNDYLFSSALTLPVVSVKPMSNLTFNWGGVTQDIQGHTVSPTTDLNTIMLLAFDLPLATFAKEATDDSLPLASVVTSPPIFTPTGGLTSAILFGDFSTGGVAVSATSFSQYLDARTYPPSDTTFAIAAQTGANLGTNIRMLQAFQLDTASTNTTINLTNGSATLQYDANLHRLHPTGVPAGKAALTLDWGKMKTNALGAAFDPLQITSVLVGHYTQTLAQLEAQFVDLETIATDLYTANIFSGAVLDFTMLADGAGNPFPGIDERGTWLVALICGNCRVPAPWYLTILEPVPQPCN
jgi:hypothetical protein